MNNYDR